MDWLIIIHLNKSWKATVQFHLTELLNLRKHQLIGCARQTQHVVRVNTTLNMHNNIATVLGHISRLTVLACCSYWTKPSAVFGAACLKSVQTNIGFTSESTPNRRTFMLKEHVQNGIVTRLGTTQAGGDDKNCADSDTVFVTHVYLNLGVLENISRADIVTVVTISVCDACWNQMSTNKVKQISLVGLRSGKRKQSDSWEALGKKSSSPPPKKKEEFQVVFLWLGWQSEFLPFAPSLWEYFKGWAIFKPVDTVTIFKFSAVNNEQYLQADFPWIRRFANLQKHFGVTLKRCIFILFHSRCTRCANTHYISVSGTFSFA